MTYTGQIRILRDHPALTGHFPGNPIVPGVLLLDRVLAGAEEWLGYPLHPTRLPHVKFLEPLLPEDGALLHLELEEANLRFVISRDGRTVATGLFELPVVTVQLGTQPP